ncbi:hypothetical protein [Weissella cibaria]|jgi:hypothetical protein|uniref:hypothetical protein n=1 Tax=Weissella cibaria TaxID=137591 RepID=UPI000ED78A93|nr:hypothetical protein [Weissella cibaria]MCB5825674.1 hypothetical protein [Weissella cibaria]MCB5857233.1 hypothetical protein [Weissella cibaria]MCB5859492.1 hypothetical protein [Weissella cibaria]MCB5861751.1 hypothetical protein [Weissella cibaria]MCB5863875.1 hypothetical protein [Weissella cibaria]
MVAWLMPFALLPKTYTYFFFDSFAQLAVLIFSMYIMVKIYLQPAQLQTVLPKTNTLRLWGAFVVVQLILMAYQSFVVGDTKQIYGLLHGLVSFIQMILVIWIAYTVQKMAIQRYEDAVKFVKSVIISLIVYIVVIVLPQIAFIDGAFWLSHIINPIAGLFERHWLDRNFYDNGSYVATLWRVNGLEPEASFLALLLGLTFSPLLIMIAEEPLKNFKNRKWLFWLTWALLAIIVVILFMAKTTTGFLMIGLLAVAYWFAAPRKQKLFIAGGVVIALIAVAAAYQFVPSVNAMLNQWLFQKGGTDNRLGGTIGLIGAWLHHPLFGVGYGYEGHYIVQNLPEWSKNNAEYMDVYKNQSYPILNDVFGWLARYGVIFVLIGFWLLLGLITRAVKTLGRLKQSTSDHVMFYRVMIKSFLVTVAITIVTAGITPANATSWPMLLMLFFYWRVVHLAEDELQNEGI